MPMTADVWILDRHEPDWEDNALRDRLRGHGMSAEIIDWEALPPSGSDGGLLLNGMPVTPPSVATVRSRVLTRHTAGPLSLLYEWLGYLESTGARLVNTARSLQRCQNKVWQAATLAAAGVPVPETRLVTTSDEIAECLTDWGETVVKPIYGHASIDVVRLRPGGPDNPIGMEEEIVVWHMLQRYRSLCAQRFVPNPGRDLRVVIIGSQLVTCHYRIGTAPDGTVKSLLHPYITEPVVVTPELEHVSLLAARSLSLDLASIDLVESDTGPVVVEVNPTVSVWQPLVGTELDLTGPGITEVHAALLIDILSEPSTEDRGRV